MTKIGKIGLLLQGLCILTLLAAAPALAVDSVTLVDQAGREVTINQPVQRLVSGYYISSSACIALDLEDRLVGIEVGADRRNIYGLAAPHLQTVPNVGSAREFNLEGCIALEPDLVILPMRLRDSADTMAQLGIPVLLVSPENHQDLVEMLTLIGLATGSQDAAARLVGYYGAELAEIGALVAPMSALPTVYMGGNSSYRTTAPRDMYQASLIRSAGGLNAGDVLDGDNWVEVSYEQLLAMNPDVIIVPAEAAYSASDVLNDAQLAMVSAVRQGRVYQMPTDFEAWDSPVPSCTLGIRWLLSVLHEDVYSLEALRADVTAFYRDFYGVGDLDASLVGK